MIHNSNRITAMKQQQKEFSGWGQHGVRVTALGRARPTARDTRKDLSRALCSRDVTAAAPATLSQPHILVF